MQGQYTHQQIITENEMNDLQFATSVNTNVYQNVSMPSLHQQQQQQPMQQQPMQPQPMQQQQPMQHQQQQQQFTQQQFMQQQQSMQQQPMQQQPMQQQFMQQQPMQQQPMQQQPMQQQFMQQGINSSITNNMNNATYPTSPASVTGRMQLLNGSAHPFACIFHCLFKTLALFVYIFNGFFFSNNKGVNFITITVCCIILLAMDFWVVKNVTGRLLVGLRWWNKIAGGEEGYEEGEGDWIFESATETKKNQVDSKIFWTVLYITPIIWGILFFSALLKFHFGWLITVSLAIALSGANVYGYWKCSTDQKAKFTRMMAKGAEMGTMAMIRNNFFGMFSNQGGGNQSQPQTQTNNATLYV